MTPGLEEGGAAFSRDLPKLSFPCALPDTVSFLLLLHLLLQANISLLILMFLEPLGCWRLLGSGGPGHSGSVAVGGPSALLSFPASGSNLSVSAFQNHPTSLQKPKPRDHFSLLVITPLREYFLCPSYNHQRGHFLPITQKDKLMPEERSLLAPGHLDY